MTVELDSGKSHLWLSLPRARVQLKASLYQPLLLGRGKSTFSHLLILFVWYMCLYV